MKGPAELPADLIERLARAIHERYLRNQRDRKASSDPAMQPWDLLPEALRASNRSQAQAFPVTVAQVGYRIGPMDRNARRSFSPGELEILARGEHDRWVRERRAAGWTPGPVKDVARKRTPYLVDWAELSERIREYDRDAIRAIPAVLEQAGLGLFRVAGGSPLSGR